MLFDERDGRHHEPRRAEATHQRVTIAERLLHWMKRAAVGQAVDRSNLLALRFNGERRARVGRAAIDDHRAGAADTAITAAFVAGEVSFVSQRVQQRHARLNVQTESLAVDEQLDRHRTWTHDGGSRLRLRDGGSGHARNERGHSSRLQEVATAAIEVSAAPAR